MQQQPTTRQVVTPFGVATVPVNPTNTMAEKTLTPEQEKAHVKRQRDAARQTLESQGRQEEADQLAHTNSEATVESHVGLAPHDKPKPKSMEAAKTDLKSVTGSPDVHRSALKTGKKTTDLVTSSPEGAQPAGGSPPPKSHVERAAEAAKAGAKKKTGKSKAKKTTEKAAS
jgi:hypothetical protein